MPFGYTLVPRDLYDLMLAKLREPAPISNGDALREDRGHERRDATVPDTEIHIPDVVPSGTDVLVALDNGQTVGVPSVVVNACIHEARGNDVVLERQLVIAARSLALGMDPQHVAMQMRAGEQVEV